MTRFLLEPGGYHTGTPTEAKSCECPNRLGDSADDTCAYCGRLPLHVIKGTWAAQDAWRDPTYALLMA